MRCRIHLLPATHLPQSPCLHLESPCPHQNFADKSCFHCLIIYSRNWKGFSTYGSRNRGPQRFCALPWALTHGTTEGLHMDVKFRDPKKLGQLLACFIGVIAKNLPCSRSKPTKKQKVFEELLHICPIK